MSEHPTITIKGRVYDLPPLNVGQVRRHAAPLLARIRTLTVDTDQEEIFSLLGDQTQLLLLALSNRYPEVTLEDVETLFMQDIQRAIIEVITLSQLTRSSQGEAKAPERLES